MRPFDLTGLRTEPLAGRPSKVAVADLGRPVPPSTPIGDWLDHLPKQLAAVELRRLRDHLVRAHRGGKTVAVALGGHVIKTGCAPYLIDLIHRGVVTAVAMNGSAAIHDFELAAAGHTSEDVGARLHAGSFGMAKETADAFAAAADAGALGGRGLGAALGDHILGTGCPHAD
ncbi:MAG: hypothetical protein K2X82_01350, partial [Gemmataceae bacterium]|nr:hypothetical protein [Gemmataceae bacterium]